MTAFIFKILTVAVAVYTLLCFIRIFITWIPGASYSSFGRFLAAICDPYLNLFRFRWLKFSAFDFSPAVAIIVLSVISSFMAGFAAGKIITLGAVLSKMLELIWNVISSIVSFLMILIFIRLIVFLYTSYGSYKGYGSYNSFWEQLDRAVSPVLFRISSLFSRGRPVPLKTAMILSFVFLLVVQIAGRFLIDFLCGLIRGIPL